MTVGHRTPQRQRPPRRKRSGVIWAALLAAALTACGTPPIRRFPQGPVLWTDDDRHDVPKAPKPTTRGRLASALANHLARPMDRFLAVRSWGRSVNVNAWDEVPDSSWFVNRNHRRPLSLTALRRGGARSAGPSLLAPWRVRWAASTRAGLRIAMTDERGANYELSFDAPGHPRLATTAELVSTLLLHALGYHVPVRHLVLFMPNQLRLTSASRWRGRDGRRRRRDPRLDGQRLRRHFSLVPRLRDGSLRAVATRVDGCKRLGPFPWRGRRPDDPNDYVDHQRRRELRGLLPVAAWLNLTTITHEVGQDCYQSSARPRTVTHRLWSLRGALGSTRRGHPKPLWEGFAPRLSIHRMLRRLFTLGIAASPWRRLGPKRRKQLARWPGLGWFPGALFSAKHFEPRITNAAFDAAKGRDLFWGGRLVASVTPAQIRAVVGEAMLPAAEAERLIQTLLARRRAVLRQALGRHAPLTDFQLRGQSLCVTDLWRREGFGPPMGHYTTRLRTDLGRSKPLIQSGPGGRAPVGHAPLERGRVCLRLPHISASYVVVEIRRPDVSKQWVKIHLRQEAHGLVIAGIAR